jgi:hypothetical protein
LIPPYSNFSSEKISSPNIPKYIYQGARRLKKIIPPSSIYSSIFFPFPSTPTKELEGE